MAGTPAQNGNNEAGNNDFSRKVMEIAATWPTPTAMERPRSPETLAKCADFRKRNANQNTVPLYLGEVARDWETPSVAVTAGSRLSRGGERSSELLLTGQVIEVSSWMTPLVADAGEKVTLASNQPGLLGQAHYFSPPVPTTPRGSRSSDLRRISLRLWLMWMSRRPSSLKAWVRKVSRPKLNPSFVDWMHGWPSEWTDCERAVTGFRPWLLRSRGELSRLLSRPTSDGQLSLFE